MNDDIVDGSATVSNGSVLARSTLVELRAWVADTKADSGTPRRDRMVRDEPSRNPAKTRARARDKRQKQVRKAGRRKG